MDGSLEWQAVHNGRSGPFRRGVCSENEESQERASERADLRGVPCGRYGSLSSHAQRGRGGDPRAVQDGPGPVNSVEAILGAAGNCSRHVQVFGGQRCCGGRRSGRLVPEALSSRCADDGLDPWLKKLDVEPADMFPPRFCGKRAYRSCRKGPERPVPLPDDVVGSSCAARVSGCERRSATSRVSLVRSTRRRTPRGFIGERWEAVNLPLS